MAAEEALLRIDGQERPIDIALVTSTDNYAKLRKIMARFFPLIGNASISHKKEGDKTVVTVVKRADSKGRKRDRAVDESHQSRVLRIITERLDEAPTEDNPALTYARALRLKLAAGRLSIPQLRNRRQGIDQVIKAGEDEAKRVKSITNKLDAASPIPSIVVPAGF
jgi:hypothetical protein